MIETEKLSLSLSYNQQTVYLKKVWTYSCTQSNFIVSMNCCIYLDCTKSESTSFFLILTLFLG